MPYVSPWGIGHHGGVTHRQKNPRKVIALSPKTIYIEAYQYVVGGVATAVASVAFLCFDVDMDEIELCRKIIIH